MANSKEFRVAAAPLAKKREVARGEERWQLLAAQGFRASHG